MLNDMKVKYPILVALLTLSSALLSAQVKLNVDTLECHIVNFSAGVLMPGKGSVSGSGGGSSMRELYKPPFVDFSIGCDYKYQSGWMVTLDGDIWFGNDNLLQRQERMAYVYSPAGYPHGTDGSIANIEAYNRSLAVRVGVARLFPVYHKNPNSGIFVKLSGGWMMQKTAFNQSYSESAVPLLTADYVKLYDNLRNGAVLTEAIGFQYMNNYLTYANFRITFELSQCWNRSSRPYQIDNLIGLNGKDNNRYFDLIYGLKLTWMFPLTGKTAYDYYY